MPTSASPSSRPSSPNPFPQLGSLPKACRFFNCLPSLGLESEVRETGGFLDHIRRDPQGEGGRPLRGGHRLRVDGEAPGHQPRGCGKTAAGVPSDREGRAAGHGAWDLRLGGEGRAPEQPHALVALAVRQLAFEQVGDASGPRWSSRGTSRPSRSRSTWTSPWSGTAPRRPWTLPPWSHRPPDGRVVHARVHRVVVGDRSGASPEPLSRPTLRKADDPGPRRAVREELDAHWSPEQISGRLRRGLPDNCAMDACREAIYQAVCAQSRDRPGHGAGQVRDAIAKKMARLPEPMLDWLPSRSGCLQLERVIAISGRFPAGQLGSWGGRDEGASIVREQRCHECKSASRSCKSTTSNYGNRPVGMFGRFSARL